MAIALPFVTFLVGAVNCYFGYRLFRILLAIWGFFLGASIGFTLAGGDNATVAIVAALIVGILGALVVSALFFVGVFVVGALFGAFISGSIMALFTNTEPNVFIVLLFALIFGLIAVWLQKLMIVVSTAFTGAGMMVSSVMTVLTGAPVRSDILTNPDILPTSNVVALLAWLLLGISGVIYQYRVSRHYGETEYERRKRK